MKKFFFLCLLIFYPAVLLHSQNIKKALFIGNSYTSVNEMPGWVAQIASSKGDSLFNDQKTPGGYTFKLHSQDTLTRAAISSRPWDLVILQEQSQLPALDPDSVAVTTYP